MTETTPAPFQTDRMMFSAVEAICHGPLCRRPKTDPATPEQISRPRCFCLQRPKRENCVYLQCVCVVVSADELLVTELLFNGVFNDLTPEQCCALLSCFVFQEKSQRHPRLTEQLSGPLRLLQVIDVTCCV